MRSARSALYRRSLSILAFVVQITATEVGLSQDQSSTKAPIRPVAVWPSGPLDVVVSLEAPVDAAAAAALVGKRIPYFEPRGPAADRSAPSGPLGALRIVAATLSDAGRTITLATDPHPRLARYVLPTPASGGTRAAGGLAPGETSYGLEGIDAAWVPEKSEDDRPLWTGWWPVLDFDLNRTLTRGSSRHEKGLSLFAGRGRLLLGTLLRLPTGNVTVQLESSQPILEASLGDAQADVGVAAPPGATYRTVLNVTSQGDPLFLSITIRTGANARPFALKASFRGADDKTDRAIGREQTILPWAPLSTAAASAPIVVPDLAGGDPARGQAIFGGDRARCSQCHAWQGQGGKIGPDLSQIGKKGRAEIYRAIAAPSASIDPDYTSYSVATKNGQVNVGVVRADGPDAIVVTDTSAHATSIPRHEIDQVRPSANSIMPVGLIGVLGEAAVRDLIAFLTSPSASRPPADTSIDRKPGSF